MDYGRERIVRDDGRRSSRTPSSTRWSRGCSASTRSSAHPR